MFVWWECVFVCYVKDEQKSLRPDADVAIWPLTLIGSCMQSSCMNLCVSSILNQNGRK